MAAITSGWTKSKLTGRLSDYAKAATGTLLLGEIQAHMIKEASKPQDRRQDVIHPSEMAKEDWCPRSTYLRIKACREADDAYLKPAESYVGVQLLNIFDEGHAIHDKWQRRLWDMGLLAGKWKCVLCDTIWEDTSPSRCPNVNSCRSGIYPEDWEGHRNTLTYREVPLKADQYLISGAADGAIPLKNALIEIKSVGVGTARIEAPDIFKANSDGQKIDLQGLWKDIKEPFPSHIRQGQLYLRLCEIMGKPYDQIVFLYESKFNQGAKEFVVKYDSTYTDSMIDMAFKITKALDGEGFSPECPTGTSCKECEVYDGTDKPDSIRLGNSAPKTEPPIQGTESPIKTSGRTARPSGRFVRPS
jgi:hypothetical protein